MEVKDLVGLSKPLTRLIEVIASGCGRVSQGYFTRRQGEADAAKIRQITSALESGDPSIPIVYKNGELEIWRIPKDPPSETSVGLPSATDARIEHVETKRQRNIEHITSNATIELSAAESVAEEKPSADWIARFFREAEDVSSEEMQTLWGRVLAGEIVRPGSFSLRTLDALRCLNTAHAKLIEKIANYLIYAQGTAVIPSQLAQDIHKSGELLQGEIILLSELGFIQLNELELTLLPNGGSQGISLVNGDWVATLMKLPDAPPITIRVYKATTIGAELAGLASAEGLKSNLVSTISPLLKPGIAARVAKGQRMGGRLVMDQAIFEPIEPLN